MPRLILISLSSSQPATLFSENLSYNERALSPKNNATYHGQFEKMSTMLRSSKRYLVRYRSLAARKSKSSCYLGRCSIGLTTHPAQELRKRYSSCIPSKENMVSLVETCPDPRITFNQRCRFMNISDYKMHDYSQSGIVLTLFRGCNLLILLLRGFLAINWPITYADG